MLLVLLALPAGAVARAADTITVADADRIVSAPEGAEHANDLKRWARAAALPELMYVLRHPPETMKRFEGMLVEEALRRVSDDRADLRRRLRLRLALANPSRARRMLGEVGRDPGNIARRARASAYRVAVLLPEDGPYAAYAGALREGIEAGLAWENSLTPLPLEARFWDTGNDDPARTAAVLDSASRESAVAIGEMLSVPTLALATGARVMGMPLISPTATDENVGAAGTTVFQVGPSGYQRGATLGAHVLEEPGKRVGMVLSSTEEDSPFTLGFAAEVQRGGGEVAWRDTYAPGNQDFRAAVKRMILEKLDVLLWDGEAREAPALLREIARQHVEIMVCGGEGLSPANQHRTTLPLLEHVRFVADDWHLQPWLHTVLDSLMQTNDSEETTSLHVRGFLAAHLVGVVVRGRALCPEEITHSLLTRVNGDPYLRERGFLDWSHEGAELPVYEVRDGSVVRLQ